MPTLAPTSSQTVGPFFLDCLMREDARRHVLAPAGTPGERIRIEGRVYDADRVGVPDALVEIWQADAAGLYHAADDSGNRKPGTGNRSGLTSFIGFGRCATDALGGFWFETVKPGAVGYDGARRQAPHVNVAVFARGLLNHLFTRMYFAGDPSNDADPVLERVPPDRRSTLMALPNAPGDAAIYRFDVVLQGAGETVFFDFVGAETAR